MKEKIILDKERENKKIGLIYHYYKLTEENNVMNIYYSNGSKNYLEKYLEMVDHMVALFFNFLRNLHTVFHSVYTNLYSH